MTYEAKCPICGQTSTVEVDETKLAMYQAGIGKIQQLFPELSVDERELIKTGICKKCWDEVFKEED